MPRRAYLLICAALAAVPASAELPAPKSAQDDLNWSIFEQLYPRRALEAHEEGAVGFTVTLDNKGEVTRCQVTHTSGHPLLDQETCQIVTLHAQFKPDPNLGPSQTKTHAASAILQCGIDYRRTDANLVAARRYWTRSPLP